MITAIPKLNKEQTKQLIEDLKQITPITTLNLWNEALKTWKKIK